MPRTADVYRVMQADNSRLSSTVEELSTQLELLQRRVAEGEAALTVEERRAREARAALDRKRQKKRAHKATAIKFQQLWQKVCPYNCLQRIVKVSARCPLLCSCWHPRKFVSCWYRLFPAQEQPTDSKAQSQSIIHVVHLCCWCV